MTAIARPGAEPRGGASGAAVLVAGGLLSAGAALALGGLVAGQPLLTLAAVATGFTAVAMLIKPDVVTLIVILVMYTNAAVVAVVVHGVPALVAALLPLLLLGPLAYHLLLRCEEVVLTPAVPWIVLLLFGQIVGTMLSGFIDVSVEDLTTFLVQGLGLYLLVTNAVRTPAMLRGAIWALLLAGSFLGAVSVVQQVTGTSDDDYFGFGQIDAAFATGAATLRGQVTQVRLAGPIGEQNRYGQIMVMIVAIGLYQALAERKLPWRLAAIGATFLAAAGAVLSFSRGALVGLALLLVVLGVLRFLRIRTLALVALGAVVIATAIPQVNSRLSTLDPVIAFVTGEQTAGAPDNSILSRLTENLTALLVFADHPIFGAGPGSYPQLYGQYANEVGLRVKAEYREAHNMVLQIGAENGIVGLIGLFGAIGATLYQCVRARRKWIARRPDLANMVTGLFAAVVAYLTTGLFLHMSYVRYFWLILALAGAAAYLALHQPDPEQPAPEAAR
jgi:O-antigen ligase